MSEPFLGQIQQLGFNFAPLGWAFCNGQLMSIAQNTALFSLLGTTYGGDGVTTFALPDCRGRNSMHFGQGPGLGNYSQGEVSGTETVTLLSTQIPQHNHLANASTGQKLVNTPSGSALGAFDMYTASAPDTVLGAGMIGQTGGNQPHDNMMPYLVINWCIALEGIYPSRN
jgi:microcystin-dependent protein